MPHPYSNLGKCYLCGGPCYLKAKKCKKCFGKRFIQPLPDSKICKQCGTDKPIDQYYLRTDNVNRLRTARAICKKCCVSNNTRPPQAARDNQLKVMYGIDREEYNAILKRQGGGCAICGAQRLLNVDHCHDTGVVRGILCNDCNNVLGRSRDDILILERAIQYLADYKLKYAQSLL